VESNQSVRTRWSRQFVEWRDPDSNRGHHDFQAPGTSRQKVLVCRRFAERRCGLDAGGFLRFAVGLGHEQGRPWPKPRRLARGRLQSQFCVTSRFQVRPPHCQPIAGIASAGRDRRGVLLWIFEGEPGADGQDWEGDAEVAPVAPVGMVEEGSQLVRARRVSELVQSDGGARSPSDGRRAAQLQQRRCAPRLS
jgi:hypothetical protein